MIWPLQTLAALRCSNKVCTHRRDYGREYFECDDHLSLIWTVISFLQCHANVVKLNNNDFIDDMKNMGRSNEVSTAATRPRKVPVKSPKLNVTKTIKKKKKKIHICIHHMKTEQKPPAEISKPEKPVSSEKIKDPDEIVHMFMNKYKSR